METEKIIENMIRWAKRETGNREYAGQYLSFINDALEKSGGSAVFVGNSANDSSESYSSALRFGAPERGALVFYDCLYRGENAPANYGHCGIALDGGAVIHALNDVRIDNYLAIEKLTSRNGDHLRYIGWVEIDRLLALKSADERSDSGCENVTSAKAIFELAMRHIYGDGVPEDNVFAFELLTRAHEMGHIEASYNLGICFHYGYGTDIDLKKAFELYLHAANAKHGKGMELVGRFYNQGIHVQRDRRLAELWLNRAIESGDDEAAEEARKELNRR